MDLNFLVGEFLLRIAVGAGVVFVVLLAISLGTPNRCLVATTRRTRR